MNAPSLSKIERLRARDGDECWACGGNLNFAAEPKTRKSATIEHLVAIANGGGNGLDNLVLAHFGCNRMLGTRPVEKKREIRAKLRANTAKQTARARGAVTKAVPAIAAAKAQGGPALRKAPEDGRYWRRLALIGGAIGLASAGFAAGLVAGLLLG